MEGDLLAVHNSLGEAARLARQHLPDPALVSQLEKQQKNVAKAAHLVEKGMAAHQQVTELVQEFGPARDWAAHVLSFYRRAD